MQSKPLYMIKLANTTFISIQNIKQRASMALKINFEVKVQALVIY